MPGITLAELVSDHATTTVKYAGKEIDIEYIPGLVTEKALADMSGMGQKGAKIARIPAKSSKAKKPMPLTTQDAKHFTELLDFTGGLNALIARLVVHWTLLENDHVTMYPIVETVTELLPGHDEPITHEVPSPRLADIPLGFRRAVLEAIFADLRMDPHKGM
jgi:hypothetical protein